MTELIVQKDSRLGRRQEFDPRSKNFPIRAMLPREAYQKPKTKFWDCIRTLDQGQEGSCVGHGFAHELIARPYPIKNIDHIKALKIYKLAQTFDEWPGENYEGTSVLAGIKATQQLFPGTIESYRWSFDLKDMVATLGHHGPIVLGINWYNGMYTPDVNNVIHVAGAIAGGHCILARGVDVQKNLIMLRNSWGPTYGDNGDVLISYDDMQRLISEGGEGCIPVHRGYWRKK